MQMLVGGVVGYSGLFGGRGAIIAALIACLVLFFIVSIAMDKVSKSKKVQAKSK